MVKNLKSISDITYNPKMVLFLLTITILINFSFPKCGFYIGKYPITLGYMLLFFSALYLIINKSQCYYKYKPIIILILILGFYTTIQFWISLSVNISDMISIFFVPLAAIIVTSEFLERRELFFEKILIYSFWFICVYGILQFCFYNLTHYTIGVAYLTQTGRSIYHFIYQFNNRSFITKAISTYNNGNILGVNGLIFFPFVMFASSRSLITKTLGRILIFITFSRTAWAGLFILEIFYSYRSDSKQIKAIKLYLLLSFILFIAVLKPHIFNFIFNIGLGGRLRQMNYLSTIHLFSTNKFNLKEMTYLGVIHSGGILYFALFVFLYFWPLIYCGLPNSKENEKLYYLKVGLLCYLFSMLIDGAYNLIPTQFIYWSMVIFLIFSVKTIRIKLHEKNTNITY